MIAITVAAAIFAGLGCFTSLISMVILGLDAFVGLAWFINVLSIAVIAAVFISARNGKLEERRIAICVVSAIVIDFLMPTLTIIEISVSFGPEANEANAAYLAGNAITVIGLFIIVIALGTARSKMAPKVPYKIHPINPADQTEVPVTQ